jgi:hypothetical protein
MDEGKSELPIAPTKPGNQSHWDPVEDGASRNTELLEGKMTGTRSPLDISTKLQRLLVTRSS